MAKNEQTVSNRLSRAKGTNKVYNGMLERTGPLNKKKNKKGSKDIFTLALAYGYLRKAKIPLEAKDNFLNETNFGQNLPALIKALAISKSEKGIHILAEDNSEVFETAEEYANGGLTFLQSEYVGKENDFIEKLRISILKNNKDDRILKKIEEMEL